MTVDIKTTSVQPRRNTFAHIARRSGSDKAASRYDEATFDMQPSANFHYRPTWAPEFELFDKRRTALEMEDWDAFKDPRQYYYGAYTIARARMMESTEKNFAFVEKRRSFDSIEPNWRDLLQLYLIPLRHFEWGANMNNCNITDLGYGAAITQATMYATMDRLGNAQILSRIGLLLDNQTGESLATAKMAWMELPVWQPIRRMVEDSLVLNDWFEQFVAQNFVFDTLVYSLVLGAFDDEGQKRGAHGVSLLTEFLSDWHDETARWVDAVLTRAAKESPQNANLISSWVAKWSGIALPALEPLAREVLRNDAETALGSAEERLEARFAKFRTDDRVHI
ncbi:aromatic/alkene monooxygenase hydroxylase subunit beta [Sphingobium phenoxybenzoativorans]|uniref:Phenol hydrolase beta subunit n=1 Tax=Sphingobium phenoxybenzoativorans TaxID=1592790 RepID=A0A1W5YR19_9SPHN|nr:aromatic/alkene monooxygenase hydroxylase subunit beta [Sphingobium phenoxybenzoativorans]ARI47606.1 phenol hydrolase beta subunit [Sphingobium phenoxybenzoativorans]